MRMYLGDIADFINGYGFKQTDWNNDGLPIIRIQNLTDESKPFNRTILNTDKKYIIERGDILVSWSGTLGVFEWSREKALLNQHIFKVIPNSQLIDKKYLFYSLQNALSEMNKHLHGATMRHINRQEFVNTKINVPSLDEQRRIAKILGVCQTNTQNLIKAIKYTEELLDSTFLSVFGSPKTNPNNYSKCKIGDITNIIGGSQPPKSFFSNSPGPEMVRLIQIRDFKTNKYQTYVPKKSCRRFFKEEDIMIGRYGPPVFQILRGLSGAYNVALMKAEPKGNVTRNFLFFLLKEQNLQNYVIANSQRTAGQSGVNLETLLKYPAFIPSQEALNKFDQIIKNIYNLQNSLQKKLSKNKELLLSLQNQLLN